jgi:formylglycine-generating enzyme required for sulfatase activity
VVTNAHVVNGCQRIGDCWTLNYNGAPTDGSARRWVDCSRRVIRGGSLHNRPRDIRAAAREGYNTGERSGLNGFRIARTLF